ncbi:MAG TPA: sigma-54 dependent transcriptional regulator [Candidatus Polarisedimenticolaceae bacterium]|nr:sigma-54 dependent transcriptional regulator [Candidatus Polarisedimenticolaceae bacterium]
MGDRILVVDDESGAREGLRRLLQAWGYESEAAASADEALVRIERERPSAVITDLVMPGIDGLEFVRRLQEQYAIPVIVFSGQGTIEAAVEAVKLGAHDFLEKPVEPAKLKILLEKLAGTRELIAENRRLRAELRERGAFGRLRGSSEAIRAVYRQIEQVAPSTLSVLIVGESGTGKELVAQTLHDLSPRRKNEFVAINCAAIPATLLESEIFGHERGAFTGAVQRKIGCFEMAHRGTLFLDEIAEMDELLQAKLLRVLQEQRFRRVGGRDIIESDVRVITATNRDPMRAIAEGRLREDLYYRLNVFTIVLPPLRERREDIPDLARYFAEEYAARNATSVSPLAARTLELLLAHSWPGNVRELKNALERSALLAAGRQILPEHLPVEVQRSAGAIPVPTVAAAASGNGGGAEVGEVVSLPVGTSMDHAEREMIRTTLLHTSGNKTRAAKILGISLKTMHNKVKKFEL